MVDLAPFNATVVEYKGEPVYLPIHVNGKEVGKFQIDMNVGSMPMMEFAYAAKSGLDTQEVDGLEAMYSLIRDTIYPADWDKFRAVAKQYKLSNDVIFNIVTTIWNAVATRPLDIGSSSQDGRSSPNGGPSSSSNASASSDLSTELASKKPANARKRTTG